MSSSYFPEFVKANSSAKLLFSMINRKPVTGDSSVGDKSNIHGTISFDKVQFTYPQKQNQPVMTNLSFKALPGQTVALVGPSGTGKSTIISLVERFYDVCGGNLKIDGKDIKSFSLGHLRTQMALVGQEPRLFGFGSIKDNICFGLTENVSDEKIQQALTLANAQ
uniref:ABC transporter domain-containing protein n=1 Tax=Panagrolaimus davidi TaxID=227884 RepID=A0A914P2E7_9BILA